MVKVYLSDEDADYLRIHAEAKANNASNKGSERTKWARIAKKVREGQRIRRLDEPI